MLTSPASVAISADVAGRAAAIIDDHLLAETFREPGRELTRDDVYRTAGRERHYPAHRFHRLRIDLRRDRRGAGGASCAGQHRHAIATLPFHRNAAAAAICELIKKSFKIKYLR
jgi:hypothetical protein